MRRDEGRPVGGEPVAHCGRGEHLDLARQREELVGGDLVVSPPFEWQLLIHENRIEVDPAQIDVPVPAEILAALLELPESRRAYLEDLYGLNAREPGVFHMTLDSTALSLEDCVDLIARAAGIRAAPR